MNKPIIAILLILMIISFTACNGATEQEQASIDDLKADSSQISSVYDGEAASVEDSKSESSKSDKEIPDDNTSLIIAEIEEDNSIPDEIIEDSTEHSNELSEETIEINEDVLNSDFAELARTALKRVHNGERVDISKSNGITATLMMNNDDQCIIIDKSGVKDYTGDPEEPMVEKAIIKADGTCYLISNGECYVSSFSEIGNIVDLLNFDDFLGDLQFIEKKGNTEYFSLKSSKGELSVEHNGDTYILKSFDSTESIEITIKFSPVTDEDLKEFDMTGLKIIEDEEYLPECGTRDID